MFLIFKGIPLRDGQEGIYVVLFLLFGLLGTWAQSGTNFPILSAIVPASSRARVMAWEGALENSIAQGVGPPLVAAIAGAVGYNMDTKLTKAVDREQAEALGTALAAVVCTPWCITFLAYGLLYCTYPRDLRKQAPAGTEDESTDTDFGASGTSGESSSDGDEQRLSNRQ